MAALRRGEVPREGAWLVADRQTAGRGRQGRQWLDAPGNFMGSTVVALREDDPIAATLSFVIALAVHAAAAMRLDDGATLQCKWPNDVLLDGAKFCGILLEREGSHVVVGVGVNLVAAPQLADREARAIGGPHAGRDAFAADLADCFAHELALWREGGAAVMFARWLGCAHPLGSPLAVHDGHGERIEGTFAGLAEDGALRLDLASGETRVIRSGDVTMERR